MRHCNGQFASGSKHLVTHGMSKTHIYGVWRSMLTRCENSNSPAFARYGKRGISVCERWKTFENFFHDMGDRAVGMTIERVDNDGPYSPENCRWATRKEQARNNSRNRMLEIDGVSKSMAEWSEIGGIKIGTIWARIKYGYDIKKAVFSPTNR